MASARTTLSLSLLLVVTASAVAAQSSKNATLAGTFTGPSGNDVWGYVNPANGKEYALVGSSTGCYVVDCSNPASPRQTGFFSSSSSGWRSSTWMDIRTYRNYAYVVTEGGGGVKIIDLSNPDSPRQVKTFTISGWRNSHNVSIDTGAGRLYTPGSSGGMYILDIKTNPVTPRLLGRYSTYAHDMHAQDGLAHHAEFYASTYRILDATRTPPVSLGTGRVGSAHTAWPTRDNRYTVTTSETTRSGNLTVFDITNPRAPRQLATYHAGGSSTSVHNAFMHDRVAHMWYYSEGYRGVDLSVPGTPAEVAYYDTSSSTSGFNGCWGCYPFQPSGTVYATNYRGGLFVIQTPATAARYGSATNGSGGTAPQLYAFGAPYQGNRNFKLELEDARANSAAFFLIGTQRSSQVFRGLSINTSLTSGVTIVVSLSTNAQGNSSLAIPIPTNRSSAGVKIHCQAIVRDAGASSAIGFSGTRGLTFEVFAR